MKIRVKESYIQRIKDRVKELYPEKKFTVPLLADELCKRNNNKAPRKKSVLSIMVGKERSASMDTLNIIASLLNIPSYDTYIRFLEKLQKLVNRLISGGYSVRYGSNGYLRFSNWDIKFDEIRNNFKVQKDSHDQKIDGEFTINEDGHLQGKLKKEHTIIIYSAFVDLAEADKINKIIFNITFKADKQVYYTQEIFYISDLRMEKQKVKGKIHFKLGSNGLITNPLYEASLSLLSIQGYRRIKPRQHNQTYKHNLFISCPITSLFNVMNETQFEDYKKVVSSIVKALMTYLDFAEQDIYCKLLKSKFGLKKDSQEVYENTKNAINHSNHFIAIIPKEIGNQNSSVFFEIFNKIIRLKPAIIFFEPSNNENNFPSILNGFMKANDQENVKWVEQSLSNIPRYIEYNSDSILDFNIK